jgi:predicted dinucleotide-utilizing enzyme
MQLTTTKPPKATGAPCVREQGINLETIGEATVVFEGTARHAVQPSANLNVAATIAWLASVWTEYR